MNLNGLFFTFRTRSQLINFQTVRWRKVRKPFWLGVAKSKMFIVPQPKRNPPEEEAKEFATLLHNYKISLKSLLNFIRKTNPKLGSYEAEKELKESLLLQKEIEESFVKNETFNAHSAELREERLKKEKEEELEKAIKLINIVEEGKKKHLEMIDALVEKEKLLSKFYITPENLDEAVEKCLNEVLCYDFAIDLDGNRYDGRESLPSHYTPVKAKTNEENVV